MKPIILRRRNTDNFCYSAADFIVGFAISLSSDDKIFLLCFIRHCGLLVPMFKHFSIMMPKQLICLWKEFITIS